MMFYEFFLYDSLEGFWWMYSPRGSMENFLFLILLKHIYLLIETSVLTTHSNILSAQSFLVNKKLMLSEMLSSLYTQSSDSVSYLTL